MGRPEGLGRKQGGTRHTAKPGAQQPKVDWVGARDGRRRPKTQVCVPVACTEAEELQRAKYQRLDPM